MKYLANAIVLATVAKAEKTQNVDGALTDAVQIMEGVVMGVLDAEFKDIEHCIEDGEAIIHDAENVWKDFQSHDFHDITLGLKAIGDALHKVKSALTDCKGVVGDFKKLGELAVVFSNPESVVWHIGKDLIVHGVDIWHECSAAVTAIESQPRQYYNFGFNIGKAAAQIIIGEEGEMALSHVRKTQAAEVLQGMMKPYGGNFNLENLLLCVYEEDQAALILYEAVQTFKEAIAKKDWQSAIGGVIMLVGFVQQAKQGLPVCEAIDTTSWNFKDFSNSIDIAAHPMEHFQLLKDDIKMHGKSIVKDLEESVVAYENRQYEKFGEIIGDILKMSTDSAVKMDRTWEASYPKDNREMIAEIFQGLMEGTQVGTFNFTNLLLCIYQADQCALEAYEGVQILEEAWQKKEWQDAIGGAIFEFAAIQSFRTQALPICEQIDQSKLDFSKVEKIQELFKNKETTMKVVGENLVFNGVTITGDYVEAMKAFEEKDYRKFGQQLGAAVLAATTPEDMYLY